jgi:DNA-binding MarR family transcriptional regulator
MLHTGGNFASRRVLGTALKRTGAGRTAYYSSLKILDELGLIVRKRKRVRDKNLVFTELTEKGKNIAEAIDELYAIIEEEFPE